MYLGIDTSNYTTSLAFFDGENIVQHRKMLTVKSGEKGLRQSEALFQHTVNLPILFEEAGINQDICAVGVTDRPRNAEGSYMPCFLAGVNSAVSASAVINCPLYKTSHQICHILAGLYSVNRLDLIKEKFIAFHISGGTTEALLVSPDGNDIISAQRIGGSNDLKAGQAIDRAGVMLGLEFPCGRELDRLSLKSDRAFKIKPSVNGCECSLSGIENKAVNMFNLGEPKEDIAKFVLSAVCENIISVTKAVINKYGDMPILFVGGVASNTIIRKSVSDNFNAYFAKPDFSRDNAVGAAVFAWLCDNDFQNCKK